MYSIVASINAKWKDWSNLSAEQYEVEKNRLCEESLCALEKIIPGIRSKIDHIEAATPKTIKHYTQHNNGASFGTKFEGLDVSSELPDHAPDFIMQDQSESSCLIGSAQLTMEL